MKTQRAIKKILVTGASGFIGGHLAAALLDRGYAVRAQYRRETIPAHLAALGKQGAELARVDLTLPEQIEGILDGVDGVIHVAALASDWGGFELFKRMNVDSTVLLVDSARQHGIRRFIHISSITVHGFGNHVDTGEDGPYYKLVYPYPITKKMAEDYVLSLNNTDFQTTVIRPGNVYGPDDTTTFYKMFHYIEKGIMGYVNKGRSLTCLVCVSDLAAAVIAAMENEKTAGQVYNITDGQKITWKELVDFMYRELGVNKRIISTPAWLSLFLAHLLSGVYKILGKKNPPPLTPYVVKQAAYHYSFSSAKARKDFGFQPRVPWQEGMRAAIKAYLISDLRHEMKR
jgi:nucleoside-diphosphate-sugar epimerase